MQKKGKSQWYLHRALRTLLFFGTVLASLLFAGALAQAQKSNFVSGEVIVHFKNDIVDFPVDAGRTPIDQVRILNPQADSVLSDPNATEYNWTASGGSATFDNIRFTLGSYNYDRYKVTKSVSFSETFTDVPVVWGRRSGSTGAVRWPVDETHFNYTYTGIEPGSESTTGCQLVPCTVSVGGGGAAARQAASHSKAELTAFYEKYGRRPPIPPFDAKIPKTKADINEQTSEPIPESYGLSQSYPNPFNPETVIEYSFARSR
ncbi:MAG: hypothetical protein ACE5IR_01965 [bacterium]